MARNPPNQTKFADEPTIIIDPSLYVPEQRWLLQTVCETFIDVTRVLGILTFSGTVAFVVPQLALSLPEFDQRAAASSAVALYSPPRQAARVVMDLQPATAAAFASDACRERHEEQNPLVAVCSAPTSSEPAAVARAPKTVRPPHDVASSVRAARRLLALNRLEEAEAAYRKVLVVDEREAAALLGLARVHLARGQLDEALLFAERAVQAAPDLAGGHLTLGDVLRARGARSRADQHYELAVQLNVKPDAATQPKQL